MRKVTLDDAANCCALHGDRQQAALVRAADEVVKAATTLCANAGVIHEDGGQEVHVLLVNTLAETLATFHKISNGEQT